MKLTDQQDEADWSGARIKPTDQELGRSSLISRMERTDQEDEADWGRGCSWARIKPTEQEDEANWSQNEADCNGETHEIMNDN